MNKLTLMIGRGTTFYDITDLVQKVIWSGRRTSAPRTLDLTIFDSEKLSQRVPSNCGEGQTVTFHENGKELFQGLLMREERRGQGRTLTLKCYDVCVRFTNNKDSFSYKKKRADQIVSDCCKRLGLTVGTLANTKHVIGELVKSATTYWDVIEDALSQTYKSTGIRYYVSANAGKVSLIKRVEQSTMQIMELNTNVTNYAHTRSIESTRTRLKLVTAGGQTKSNATVTGMEAKIGQFQEMETVDSKITNTEVKQRIQVFKTEQGVINESLKIWALGDSSIKSGGCVFANLPNVGTNRIMYIEEDTHTWEKGAHTMTVTLDYAKTAAVKSKIYKVKDESSSSSGSGGTVISSSSEEPEPAFIIEDGFYGGNHAYFNGGIVYDEHSHEVISEDASAGLVTVVMSVGDRVLVSTLDPEQTTVYGWVDKSTLTKPGAQSGG